MADAVYLRTNRFEVKLEGIATKTRDFKSLCKMDFLFPNGKVRARPPIVGLDVMNHPRDPKILLVLLCFGIGCVILRLNVDEPLPPSIHKFLSDKRIHFVGFGVPEKRDLFPFEELGLSKSKVDIGYIASRVLKDSKYKKWELSELARKVLGIKKMIALTDESSFVRHEQIKCAICQLFITSVIGIKLLGADNNNDWDKNKKKSKIVSALSEASLKKGMSFLKNLNSLRLLSESWFKLPIGKKKKQRVKEIDDFAIDEKTETLMNPKCMDFLNLGDCFVQDVKVEDAAKKRSSSSPKGEVDDSANNLVLEEAGKVDLSDDVDDRFSDEGKDSEEEEEDGDDEKGEHEEDNKDSCKKIMSYCDVTTTYHRTKPLKGILKCPSSNMLRTDSFMSSLPGSPPPTPNDQAGVRGSLRRANSKGCNVSFKCDALAFS